MAEFKDADASSPYHETTGVGSADQSLARRSRAIVLLAVGRLFARFRRIRFEGRELPYVVEPYNLTCVSERGLELGIIQAMLPEHARVLELGNVWGHYRDRDFKVVDKYEIAPGVENIDIVDIPEDQKYDFIFSISTFEHIGWDEEPRHPEKLARALEKIPKLLAESGEAVVTVPSGWNSWLDERLVAGDLPVDSIDWYKRTGLFCSWRSAEAGECAGQPYGGRHQAANAVAVLRFKG